MEVTGARAGVDGQGKVADDGAPGAATAPGFHALSPTSVSRTLSLREVLQVGAPLSPASPPQVLRFSVTWAVQCLFPELVELLTCCVFSFSLSLRISCKRVPCSHFCGFQEGEGPKVRGHGSLGVPGGRHLLLHQ